MSSTQHTLERSNLHLAGVLALLRAPEQAPGFAVWGNSSSGIIGSAAGQNSRGAELGPACALLGVENFFFLT